MKPDTTTDDQNAVAKLIEILRLTEQINSNDETVKRNSDCGEYNYGIIVT